MKSSLGKDCQNCVQTEVDTRTARRIEAFYLQATARRLLPRERVASCLRQIIPGKLTVDVARSLDDGSAHLLNLQTCSRVWQCPVCAGRISNERGKELLTATTKWHEDSGFCALFTFTLSHIAKDPLTSLLGALREAHRAFKSGRWFQEIRTEYGWRGSVSALEVTYGLNGWHPHLHELVFFDPMYLGKFEKLSDETKLRWVGAIAKQKQYADLTHGLDIRETDSDIYEYVSKYGRAPSATRWTAEREITRAPVKRSSRDGSTAWQLLAKAAEGDKQAARLFVEYSSAFKGKQQLVWSKGLRELLGMKEIQDDEISETESQAFIVMESLSSEQWHKLMRLPKDVRGELLKLCSLNDAEQLKEFIAECLTKTPD